MKKDKLLQLKRLLSPFLSLLFLLIAALFQVSCTSKQVEVGYSFGDVGIDKQYIKSYLPEGHIGELQVMQLLGSPSVLENIECRRFYYIQSTYIKKPILAPKLINRKILEIDFDNQHVVSRVNFYENKLQPSCKICNDETKIEGNQMSLVQQLARNIGRFNAGPGNKPQ